MTGDSENEIESPGGSSVPSADPRPDGENSFRPFRGWASAYEPPPSLWSRISGIFSRKRKVDDAHEVIEAPNSLLADAHALADEPPVAPPDDFQFPFARPEVTENTDSTTVDAALDAAVDETVDELHVIGDADAEAAPVSSIPIVTEPPAPRRGFFSRLFSRRSPERDAAEPHSDEPWAAELPADERWTAEPADAPVQSVDEAQHAEALPFIEDTPPSEPVASPFTVDAAHAETAESLDVVREEPVDPFEPVELSASEEPVESMEPVEPVEPEIPAFLHEPPRYSRPVPAMDEPESAVDRPNLDDPAFFIPEEAEPPAAQAPEPGFFSRLIRRFSRPVKEVAEPEVDVIPEADVQADAEVQPEETADVAEFAFEAEPEAVKAEESLTQADEALAAANDFFTDDTARSDLRFAPPTFETIDEALPTPVVPMPPAAPPSAPVASQTDDFLFGDTIDPADVVPAFDSPTMEEIVDARPTVETTPQRDTVRADILDEESTDEFVQPVPPEVDAAAEAERPPFFVPKFRSFYNEIVLYKHQKSQFTGGFATAIVDYTADLSPDAAAQGLSKRLQEILELQHAEAQWMGGEAAARYPDAQYAMAVLADELFTHMEWPGQAAWPKYLLELRMFRTHAADVEFFKRVDRLLKNESDNPSRAARDLARLYLLVLASGFRGKYRQPNLTRPLAEYRRRLYEFIYEGDPLMLYAPDRRLFPEAMERTLESKAVARFSGLQQWAAALIVILVGYTLLANMAWKRVSADLTDVTARVEAASRTTSSDGSWGSAREDSLR